MKLTKYFSSEPKVPPIPIELVIIQTGGTLGYQGCKEFARMHGARLPTVNEIREEIAKNSNSPLFPYDMWWPADNKVNTWVSVGNFDYHKRLGRTCQEIMDGHPHWNESPDFVAQRSVIALAFPAGSVPSTFLNSLQQRQQQFLITGRQQPAASAPLFPEEVVPATLMTQKAAAMSSYDSKISSPSDAKAAAANYSDVPIGIAVAMPYDPTAYSAAPHPGAGSSAIFASSSTGEDTVGAGGDPPYHHPYQLDPYGGTGSGAGARLVDAADVRVHLDNEHEPLLYQKSTGVTTYPSGSRPFYGNMYGQNSIHNPHAPIQHFPLVAPSHTIAPPKSHVERMERSLQSKMDSIITQPLSGLGKAISSLDRMLGLPVPLSAEEKKQEWRGK